MEKNGGIILGPWSTHLYNNDPKHLTFSLSRYKFVSKILKNLTACWLEGVVPWGSEYLRLDQLNKYIPTENLEYLRIRDCLAMQNLDFPYMPKLKFLHLSPGLNHQKKKTRSRI